eukprot:TRINITY_DN17607_c0_g1_i1.p1 TRINITY_DN17607_c0_g1~~TRINITY_DN17607_c0_g1_i1.p1  ORF type:complete len:1205 (+),score=331.46 TRINITY_DN17607_c0_g1_i1:135-3617(+)
MERSISQLNNLLQSIDWPPDSSEQGRTFQDTFKRGGYQWFKDLCNRVSGLETNDDRFRNTWKDFDPMGAWLDTASDQTVGPALTRELMDLLHPNGRLMSYVQSLSDPKRVLDHWAQCRLGRDPDLSTGNYIGYPFNCLPDHTQRDWCHNWRNAIGGLPPAAHGRQAALTPIYHHPHWCPVAHDTPFHTENGTVTEVMMTPFSYFMMRFGLYLWKRAEMLPPQMWLPKLNVLDSCAGALRRVTRGASYVARVVQCVSQGNSAWDISEGRVASSSVTEHKLVTMAEMQPGYALVFDLFQACYLPAPEQPFLAPFTPAKFQKCVQEGMYTTHTGNIPQYCSVFFAACLDEAWARWVHSLYNLVTSPSERFEPAKGAKAHEGAPCVISVHAERAKDDLHTRTIILSQPLRALLRAVQYHDFLQTFPKSCMPQYSAGRTAGFAKVLLPQAACRDFRGSITQYLHITMSMANSRSGDVLRYPSTSVMPLCETLSLWASLLSPYRISSVRLPDAAQGQATPVCGHSTAQPPCLLWLHTDLSAAHPTPQMHPVARFVRLVCAMLEALGEEVSGALLDCLPSRFDLEADVLRLEALCWVRAHHSELSLLTTKLSNHPPLLALADAAVAKEATSLSLPAPPRNASLALMYDAQAVLAGGAGAPFLADWELTYLSRVGKKPSLLETVTSPQVQSLRRRVTLSCGGLLKANVGGKTGPLPLTYANCWLWRETKDVLKAAVQTMSAGGAPFRIDQLCQAYAREHHEAYSALFTAFLEVLHSEFVRDERQCTAAHLAALHRILACITHPTVSKGLEPDAPALQHYLPPDAWKPSADGLRSIEERIASLCLDLRYRQRQIDSGAEAQNPPSKVVSDMVDMLISLNAGVPARLEEMEKMEQRHGYDAGLVRDRSGPAQRGGSVQPYVERGLNESRLTNSDYDGYALSETGRAKVLSGGAPFEFRDFRQRGVGWVEVNGPESRWRNLASKLQVEQKARMFPYRRPADMHELPPVVRLTQTIDTVVYRIVDALFLHGIIDRGLHVRWINAYDGKHLPHEVSSALEKAYAEVVQGTGKTSLTINVSGKDALEVDLAQAWAKAPGEPGFLLSRALFDPPSVRFLARDYHLAIAALILLFVLCYYAWLLWTAAAAVALFLVAGAVASSQGKALKHLQAVPL